MILIAGQPAKFFMYENTKVSGEFRGSELDFHDLFVRNLETPLGVLPEVKLRACDLFFMEIDKV